MQMLDPLHETIDHLFLAGLLEGDGELVAVDLHHMAVAEFLVEHAVIEREFRNRAGRFRDQFAFDGHWRALAARQARRVPGPSGFLGPCPGRARGWPERVASPASYSSSRTIPHYRTARGHNRQSRPSPSRPWIR